MLKADFLQDAFHMSGNNEEAFEELLQEIDAHTCYHPVALNCKMADTGSSGILRFSSWFQ